MTSTSLHSGNSRSSGSISSYAAGPRRSSIPSFTTIPPRKKGIIIEKSSDEEDSDVEESAYSYQKRRNNNNSNNTTDTSGTSHSATSSSSSTSPAHMTPFRNESANPVHLPDEWTDKPPIIAAN